MRISDLSSDVCSSDLAAYQAIQMADLRQHGAEKQISLGVLDQDGRKVFDVFVIEQFRALFNIYPHERMIRPFIGQSIELRTAFSTGIAPCGAIAGDNQPIVFFQAIEKGGLIMQMIDTWHRNK